MKGLKVERLIDGRIYMCGVTGKNMLVKKMNFGKVMGIYFNEVTGKYDDINVLDGWLFEITDGNPITVSNSTNAAPII